MRPIEYFGLFPVRRNILDELERFGIRPRSFSEGQRPFEAGCRARRRGQAVWARGGADAIVWLFFFEQKIEDTRRKVHRTGQHAGKRNNRRVVWRVSPIAAPCIVFLPAGTFAGHHVRVGPTDAGRFDRLVNVQHHVVLCRSFDDLAIMTDHVLAVVPFVMDFAVVAGSFDCGSVPHVAGLHCLDSELLTQGICIVELAFVVFDSRACFMMPDESDAFFLCVVCKELQIVIRVGGS